MKHLGHVAVYFYTTPFFNQAAVFVDDKCTALYATNLFAIHVFHLDHAKKIAGQFFCVCQQIKGKSELRFKVFVRFDAVA